MRTVIQILPEPRTGQVFYKIMTNENLNSFLTKGVETIQGWKLFNGGNYLRKYGISSGGFVTDPVNNILYSLPNNYFIRP